MDFKTASVVVVVAVLQLEFIDLTPLVGVNNNEISEFTNKRAEGKRPECIRKQNPVFTFLAAV